MEVHIDGAGMSGILDWSLKEPSHKDSVLCDEIPDMSRVWGLGLGVERNTEVNLRITKKELGISMCLWTKRSEGMREPGNLKAHTVSGRPSSLSTSLRFSRTASTL